MKLSELDFDSLLETLANSMSLVTTKEAKQKLIAHDRAQRSEITRVSEQLADMIVEGLHDLDFTAGANEDALDQETEHYTEVDPDA